MANGLPYFKWWAADAETDDFYAGLSMEELGVYHRCLNRSWMNGGIPADMGKLSSIIGVPRRQLEKAWLTIGSKWVKLESDPSKLVNARQEGEREKAKAKSENNKRPGNANAKGSRKIRVPIDTPRVYDCVSGSASEGFLEEKRQFPQTRKVIEHPGAPTQESDDRFEEIWRRWPRQTNKNSAAMDWVSVVTPANVAEVVACAERYLASDEARRGVVKNLGCTPEKTGWLIDCARDNWESDWPKAAQPAAKKSNFDLAMEGLR